MRRLDDALEHLDGALSDMHVLDGNLRDLRRVNRRFGGTALSLRAMRELVALDARPETGTPDILRILDVGCGAADMPPAFASAFAGAAGTQRSALVTAVDSRPEILAAARRISPELASRPDVVLAVADGRSLPYPDGAFDIAHASLLLHHLHPGEAVPVLRELGRVARIGIVVNDLERGWRFWLGAWLVLHAMTRNPFTLHDGPLSVRRAYARREMHGMLAQAGLRPVAEAVGFAGHRWAIAAVRA